MRWKGWDLKVSRIKPTITYEIYRSNKCYTLSCKPNPYIGASSKTINKIQAEKSFSDADRKN